MDLFHQSKRVFLAISFFTFFPLTGVIFELIGSNKPALLPFFTQITANFVRFVFIKTGR